MESQKGSSDNVAKLLKAQSHIYNHTYSFIRPMCLKCAVDLGIPDVIHNYGKPMPLSKLISSLSIHPSKTIFIQRLMRILTHSGFFITTQKNDDSDDEIEIGYVLTDSSMLLTKDNPFSMIPFLTQMLDPIMTSPWLKLPNWFKNEDRTAFETEHGKGFEVMLSEAILNQPFNNAMASDARLMARAVVEKCKSVFEGLESLVDVGGGTGNMAKALAKEFPKMECTVLDLPHVVAGLEGFDNLKFVAGDMFQAIPPADAILLKWILHDWNDEKCVEILRKCKESFMSKGKKGKVIIIDMVVMDDGKAEDDESLETQHFLDMLMMVFCTGKERNEKEWNKLIFSAGFTDYKISHVLGLRSLIEIYP